MRFVMKKKYYEDIRLFKYRSTFFWYLALVIGCLTIPIALDDYFISILTFICIYAVGALGLMLLAGFTGQVSMGHAAFFAIGSYTAAIITTRGGPLLLAIPAAGIVAGVMGIIIGLPVLRLSGLYLSIATIALAFIVEEILVRWESLTRGNLGIYVESPSIGPLEFSSGISLYYLSFVVLIIVILLAKNILRSPTGRAMIAIRDSEVAAQAMGISLPKFKTTAFAISAFFTGIAGALYAYKISFINPESYTLLLSIEFLAMIIIGGLGSVHGAIFGAIFFVVLPNAIILTKDYLPKFVRDQTGLEAALFGLMIILFILFEPMGLYGRWLKIKYYFETFPLYKKDTFKREKSYQKVERQ